MGPPPHPPADLPPSSASTNWAAVPGPTPCRPRSPLAMREPALPKTPTGSVSLCRTGEHGRARKHFLQAASLTSNTRERATMQRRAAECAAQHGGESSE
jgi:hypothetical protein